MKEAKKDLNGQNKVGYLLELKQTMVVRATTHHHYCQHVEPRATAVGKGKPGGSKMAFPLLFIISMLVHGSVRFEPQKPTKQSNSNF